MADDETKSIVQQALTIYYQMRSYPELRTLLDQHKEEIAHAIQQKDPQTLIGIVQKVQSDFQRGLSEKAYQVQVDTERKITEARINPDEIASRVNAIEQALSETLRTTEALYNAKKLKSREFIEKLVKNYSRLPESETHVLTDAIVANAETYANLSPKEIIQNASSTMQGVSPDAINKLLRNHEVVETITDIQKNNITTIEQRVIGAVLDSPEPMTTIGAINRYVEKSETKPPEIPDLIEKAKLVSTASSIVRRVPGNSVPDYEGFFTSLAQTGNPIEKAFAPLADAMLSIFPSNTKEAIVTSVMSSLWKKETRAGGVVQGALGSLFQSDVVTKAIQQGNAVFSTTSKGGIITPVQSFFGDVITTVFHPTTTTVWMEMIRTNTVLPTTSYQYFLSLFARRGSEEAAKAVAAKLSKKAVREVGKKVATTTFGKGLGAFFGSFLGPGIGTFVGWLVGDIIIDKALSFVGRAVSGFFNLLSFKFLTDLVSGDVPTTPLWEQEGAKWLLIGAGVLLFIVLFPISLFGLTGANYQKLVDDNAFVQALGTGNEYQYADCENNPTDPLCSMTPCDPSVQDCRWPTSGTITQGPFTSCGGTHAYANAIDIGASNGTDVYATIHGRVTRIFTGCPDYVGYLGNPCGGYLGNHIIIEGISPYDYTLKFGHLLSASIRVSEGQGVFPNDVIGEVDNSGSSSGPHLHFSFIDNSGQNRSINSILPFAIDHCVNSAPGCTVCNYPAVGGGGQ